MQQSAFSVCKLGKKSWLDIKGSQYSFSLNSHYRRPHVKAQLLPLLSIYLTSMSLEKSCENIYMPSSTAGWQRWSLIWCWKCVIATEADALRHSLTSGPSDLLNNFTTEQNSLCLCEKVYSLEMRVLSRSFNPFKPIPGGVGMLWCLFRQRAGRYSFFSYVFCI